MDGSLRRLQMDHVDRVQQLRPVIARDPATVAKSTPAARAI